MQAVYECALVITLEVGEFMPGCLALCRQAAIDVVQGICAVNVRLTVPKQVQIGAVQRQNAGHMVNPLLDLLLLASRCLLGVSYQAPRTSDAAAAS